MNSSRRPQVLRTENDGRRPGAVLACSQRRSGFRRWIDGAAGWAGVSERVAAGPACPSPQSINAERGVRCVDSVGRAQIADGVRGRRAAASESTRRAECAAPCLSLHVTCRAGVLAFCVAEHGHAARRRLSERYKERDAGRGGVLRGGARPCSPAASQLTIPEAPVQSASESRTSLALMICLCRRCRA